jgi:CrcB protein
MANNVAWIAAGGAAGSVARYLMTVGVQRAADRVARWAQRPSGGLFPWGTLSVNIIGSLLIGYLSVRLVEAAGVAPHQRLGVLVGILGGFTTFSSFSLETMRLVEDGQFLRAAVNVTASVLACLAACWIGLRLARGTVV